MRKEEIKKQKPVDDFLKDCACVLTETINGTQLSYNSDNSK